ncbi:unnamed protein product, partial [Heterosigma akashiwo]
AGHPPGPRPGAQQRRGRVLHARGAGPGPRRRFRAAGAADTLHKPCAKAQLQAAVAKFCAMLEAQDKANEAVEDELLDDSREEDLLQTC